MANVMNRRTVPLSERPECPHCGKYRMVVYDTFIWRKAFICPGCKYMLMDTISHTPETRRQENDLISRLRNQGFVLR